MPNLLLARTTGASSASGASRVPEVDLLRFLASLAVVYFHSIYQDSPVRRAAQFGFLGVHVFFVISGFVIVWTASSKDAYGFLASRVSRLYPSYWICCVITFAALWYAGEAPSVPQLLANLTMIPGALHQPALDEVYWTLNVELKFYALVLLLLVSGQMVRIERWLYAWLIYCIAARWLPSHFPFQTPMLLGFAPLFIAGSLLYLVYRDGPSAARLTALAVSTLLAAYMTATTEAGFTARPDTSTQTICVLILLAALTLFLLIALRRFRLPSSPLWYWLGGMTYPLYLIHYRAVGAILTGVPKTWWHASVHILIALALAALLAAVSERRLCPLFHRLLLHAREGLRNRRLVPLRGSPP
jgi:peptidoglycan/LPS O-acetylase OafA/YrhL